MPKVNSWWWQKGPSRDFHAKDKPMLMGVFNGSLPFNTLKNFILHPGWLTTANEPMTKSMTLMGVIKDEYIREMPKLLRGTKTLNQLAIKKTADFVFLLHRSDDMYYERFGYLMWMAIEVAPRWLAADVEQRKIILHEMREHYFTVEGRQDRIPHLNQAWDWLENHYASDAGIQRSVDFIIERLHVHRDMYDRDEISRLGMKAFYPENWYPRTRGALWDQVHGGRG